ATVRLRRRSIRSWPRPFSPNRLDTSASSTSSSVASWPPRGSYSQPQAARRNADALRGALGPLARSLVLAEVTSTLEEAARDTAHGRAVFVPGSESGGVFFDRWDAISPASRSQRALLAAAGECCDIPELREPIARLLDRTDELCLSILGAIDRSEV